jgi:hypothetical protein
MAGKFSAIRRPVDWEPPPQVEFLLVRGNEGEEKKEMMKKMKMMKKKQMSLCIYYVFFFSFSIGTLRSYVVNFRLIARDPVFCGNFAGKHRGNESR